MDRSGHFFVTDVKSVEKLLEFFGVYKIEDNMNFY